MITCRRPDHTMSNICRYGFHDSIVLASSVAPTGYGPPIRSASPSVITRSGSKLARASRPPIIGTLPIGLARISPSPRKHSAIATTQYSARVIRSVVSAISPPPPAPLVRAARAALRGRDATMSVPSPLRSQPHHLPVLGVITAVEVLRLPFRPRLGRLRAGGVRLLELLVARVVGHALGEVGAEGRLDHAVGHEPVDLQRLHRAVGREVVGLDDPLDTHEPLVGRHAEQVVEVGIDVQILPVAAPVAAVHVDQRDV